ncbi:tripartite tricarboxylate transporter substrate binding protein [Verminephrobacter aporrectodeae subsp. tuberculatae]|uniref:Bug family tripartite tricarboxylate transporter substrate binding protein n=1 Tax=Verminephrobacter aporrectodeae TaxID=1110389 RepID=UPI0022438E60|nr:tripartite tricarboxylate transporter substrate binding protein [Verminephrobacter aporrectodeae]MCW8198125.1 tripartite tricarboxylate transporter substrate binding protein [Verminephrobacter aporrectodeae subsp. tuberculatae]
MQKRMVMAGALALALVSGTAVADPARVMIPANPGGGWDGAARHTLAAFARSKVFTDGASFTNKGGAAGTIGLAEFVRTAKGDDNALMVTGVIMVGGTISNKTPVSLADTTPLLRLTNEYNAIAVPAASPIRTVQDFMQALQTDPGALPVGGGSAGSVDHVMLALLAKHAGAPVSKINFVSFSGSEILTALGGGKLRAAISGVSEFRRFADSGRIRIIAVSGPTRVEGLNAPTLRESGIPVEMGNWRGFVGAPGMSAAARKLWLDRFAALHGSAVWQETLKTQGWEDAYLPGDAFAAFLKSEEARWSDALRDVGILK